MKTTAKVKFAYTGLGFVLIGFLGTLICSPSDANTVSYFLSVSYAGVIMHAIINYNSCYSPLKIAARALIFIASLSIVCSVAMIAYKELTPIYLGINLLILLALAAYAFFNFFALKNKIKS